MTGLQICIEAAGWAGFFVPWFLWLALAVAAVETAFALAAKFFALNKAPRGQEIKGLPDPDKMAKIIEALTKLLLALKDLPLWIAIFLAGGALLWTAIAAPNLCVAG